MNEPEFANRRDTHDNAKRRFTWIQSQCSIISLRNYSRAIARGTYGFSLKTEIFSLFSIRRLELMSSIVRARVVGV